MSIKTRARDFQLDFLLINFCKRSQCVFDHRKIDCRAFLVAARN